MTEYCKVAAMEQVMQKTTKEGAVLLEIIKYCAWFAVKVKRTRNAGRHYVERGRLDGKG